MTNNPSLLPEAFVENTTLPDPTRLPEDITIRVVLRTVIMSFVASPVVEPISPPSVATRMSRSMNARGREPLPIVVAAMSAGLLDNRTFQLDLTFAVSLFDPVTSLNGA